MKHHELQDISALTADIVQANPITDDMPLEQHAQAHHRRHEEMQVYFNAVLEYERVHKVKDVQDESYWELIKKAEQYGRDKMYEFRKRRG